MYVASSRRRRRFSQAACRYGHHRHVSRPHLQWRSNRRTPPVVGIYRRRHVSLAVLHGRCRRKFASAVQATSQASRRAMETLLPRRRNTQRTKVYPGTAASRRMVRRPPPPPPRGCRHSSSRPPLKPHGERRRWRRSFPDAAAHANGGTPARRRHNPYCCSYVAMRFIFIFDEGLPGADEL